jgi:hypothetical protein
VKEQEQAESGNEIVKEEADIEVSPILTDEP